jgi:hypothetical protein
MRWSSRKREEDETAKTKMTIGKERALTRRERMIVHGKGNELGVRPRRMLYDDMRHAHISEA